jgi:hypothetical protein
MPRNVDPAGITVGVGAAAPKSVDDTALRNPDRDTLSLKAHVKDPSQAHMAVAIRITDAANYFTADEVEGALQELGGGLSAGRTNGVVSGGTWTSMGNVLTMDATQVIIGASLVTVTGLTIALADGTRWVYVDPATGNLASSGSPPALAGEPVLISRVVAVAGTINTGTSQDARFFVPQLDRKCPLTLRNSDAATNANAEGCFMTLEAALLYLQTYSPANASQAETQTIVVRGNITIAATATIPIDGIRFVGDGKDSAFVTGATLAPMFNLAGRTGTQFHKITFQCEHTGSTALEGSAATVRDLQVEDCVFTGGAQEWVTAINLSWASGYNRATIKNTSVDATGVGIFIDRPQDTVLYGVVCTEQGTAGTYGIRLNASGPFAGEGDTHIVNSRVSGFAEGVVVAGDGCSVRGSTLQGADVALTSLGGQVKVVGCTILVDATTGTTGIRTSGSTLVSDCYITCNRSSWSGEVPVGVDFLAGTVPSHVSNCVILGFVNGASGNGVAFPAQMGFSSVKGSTIQNCGIGVAVAAGSQAMVVSGNIFENTGKGVQVLGLTGATTFTHDIVVSGNSFKSCVTQGVYVFGAVSNISISGNSIDNGLAANIFTPTADGIYVGANDTSTPEYVNISDNEIWRCAGGVILRGDKVADAVRYASVTGNHIHHCAQAQDISGWVDTFVGRGSKGIGLEFCDSPLVANNTLVKIGASINDAGTEGWANGGGGVIDIQSRAIYARNCRDIRIENNVVRDTVANDVHGSGFALPYGIFTEVHSVGTGADHTVEGYAITGNQIYWGDSLSGVSDGGEYGIWVEVSQGSDTFANQINSARVCDNNVYRTRRSGVCLQFSGGCGFTSTQLSRNKIGLTCQIALGGPGTPTDQAGILVEALDAGTGDITLVSTQIFDNQVDDSAVTAATSGDGIHVILNQEGTVQNLSICRNTVLRSENNAIYVEASNSINSGTSSYGGWVLSDNLVRTTTSGAGVRVALSGTGTGSNSLDTLVAQNNTVRDAFSNGVDVLVTGDMTQAKLDGNTCEGVAIGVLASGNQVAAGLSKNISLSDNTIIDCTMGVYLRGYDRLETVSIRGNTVDSFTTKGVWFVADDTSDTIAIDGNVLRSGSASVTGLDIDLPNAAVHTMSVSNNTVRLAGATDFSMNCDAAGGAATQFTMVFLGNVFYGATTGATAGANFIPDDSQCSCNVERTAAGAGNWGNGGGGFTAAFGVNSTTVNNQD